MKLSWCTSTIDIDAFRLRADVGMKAAHGRPELTVTQHGNDRQPLLGYPESMQRSFNCSTGDIVLFAHDDVTLLEKDWDLKLLDAFKRIPKLGLAGFAGGKQLGDFDMYKHPFDLRKMRRYETRMSLIDWRKHKGARRATRPTRVAMLDGLALAVRRDWFQSIGGWSWFPFPHHGYDLALSCMAARHGLHAYVLPIECHHDSGKTASSSTYLQSELLTPYGSDAELHRQAHEWVYNEFRDVLPIKTCCG